MIEIILYVFFFVLGFFIGSIMTHNFVKTSTIRPVKKPKNTNNKIPLIKTSNKRPKIVVIDEEELYKREQNND